MKKLSVLGSTGSIGVSTLDVVERHPDSFRIVALAAGRNIDRLEAQVRAHRPSLVAVADAAAARELGSRLSDATEILHGEDGRRAVATHADSEMVVSALVGALGLPSTHAAVESGRDVALANKETLVVAGSCIVETARASGSRLLPVDSEHNALHQCLRGERTSEVRRLWLTASGGPFRGCSLAELQRVTSEAALRHPTWKMGPKITIDSATLMNKGLEVIEARWLFDVGPEAIRVVVHPQSVVHSMVELVDGSFKAQLGVTDMRHPIQYALTWPERWPTTLESFDPIAVGRLDFEAPDTELFPCLRLAFDALRSGGGAPAVLNAANEVAAAAFLEQRIAFLDIPKTIELTLERHGGEAASTIDELLALDRRARQTAEQSIGEGAVR